MIEHIKIFKSAVLIIFSIKIFALSSMEGLEGEYSAKVLSYAEKIQKEVGNRLQGDLKLNCFYLPEKKNIVAVVQSMSIKAPLQEVARVLEDFSNYATIFPDLRSVKVLARKGNQLTTEWIQESGFIFMPESINELNYVLDNVSKNQKTYYYRLKKARYALHSDGFVFIVAHKNETNFFELDILEANIGSGFLQALTEGFLWQETVKALAISDMSLKMKLEGISSSKGEATQWVKKNFTHAIQSCIDEKKPLSDLWSKAY